MAKGGEGRIGRKIVVEPSQPCCYDGKLARLSEAGAEHGLPFKKKIEIEDCSDLIPYLTTDGTGSLGCPIPRHSHLKINPVRHYNPPKSHVKLPLYSLEHSSILQNQSHSAVYYHRSES